MKRWNRTLSYLLAVPAIILAGIVLHASSLSPLTKASGEMVICTLLLVVLAAQTAYQFLRDQKALETYFGVVALATGVMYNVAEVIQPSTGLAGRELFFFHASLATIVVVGVVSLSGWIKTPPKHWRAGLDAWQRESQPQSQSFAC